MAPNEKLAELSQAGVAVWLDDLSRDRIRGGGPQSLADGGLYALNGHAGGNAENRTVAGSSSLSSKVLPHRPQGRWTLGGSVLRGPC